MKLALPCKYFSATILALAILVTAPAGAPRAQQVLGIAAVVNEEVISLYDLQSRINLLIATSKQENTTENRRRHTGPVLNQLINEKLQLQEAKRLGVDISEKEVERAYVNIASSNEMTQEQLSAYLEGINVEKEMLLGQLRAQIAWGRAVNRLFRSEISIGSEEVDEIIAEIKESKGKPEYLVGEIFLPVDRPENSETHRANANNIISQLNAGASFSVLARNYSQSATAAVGGDLGWVRQGQLSAELDKVVTAMADGALSEPIQTISGFYILLRRGTRIGQGLASVDEQVDLFQVFLPLAPAPSEADIKAGLDAVTTMTAGATSCDDMAEIGKQTGSALSGRLGKVKISSLPPQTRELVENIEIHKPSRPIRSGDGVVVLMVCGREGELSVNEFRDKVEKTLLDGRLDILARRHLRDLRRTAFLDIRI